MNGLSHALTGAIRRAGPPPSPATRRESSDRPAGDAGARGPGRHGCCSSAVILATTSAEITLDSVALITWMSCPGAPGSSTCHIDVCEEFVEQALHDVEVEPPAERVSASWTRLVDIHCATPVLNPPASMPAIASWRDPKRCRQGRGRSRASPRHCPEGDFASGVESIDPRLERSGRLADGIGERDLAAERMPEHGVRDDGVLGAPGLDVGRERVERARPPAPDARRRGAACRPASSSSPDGARPAGAPPPASCGHGRRCRGASAAAVVPGRRPRRVWRPSVRARRHALHGILDQRLLRTPARARRTHPCLPDFHAGLPIPDS